MPLGSPAQVDSSSSGGSVINALVRLNTSSSDEACSRLATGFAATLRLISILSPPLVLHCQSAFPGDRDALLTVVFDSAWDASFTWSAISAATIDYWVRKSAAPTCSGTALLAHGNATLAFRCGPRGTPGCATSLCCSPAQPHPPVPAYPSLQPLAPLLPLRPTRPRFPRPPRPTMHIPPSSASEPGSSSPVRGLPSPGTLPDFPQASPSLAPPYPPTPPSLAPPTYSGPVAQMPPPYPAISPSNVPVLPVAPTIASSSSPPAYPFNLWPYETPPLLPQLQPASPAPGLDSPSGMVETANTSGCLRCVSTTPVTLTRALLMHCRCCAEPLQASQSTCVVIFSLRGGPGGGTIFADPLESCNLLANTLAALLTQLTSPQCVDSTPNSLDVALSMPEELLDGLQVHLQEGALGDALLWLAATPCGLSGGQLTATSPCRGLIAQVLPRSCSGS